ncbi:hypothetical protein [Nonomuraea sp. NPDC049400]|uniref:hypothetical protein n=1 Tax=Nonomuraea sp. NPDC049400 TaxID=3364352 RepID=UPI00379EE81C
MTSSRQPNSKHEPPPRRLKRGQPTGFDAERYKSTQRRRTGDQPAEERPFPHVAETKTAAIALYERLGFGSRTHVAADSA